MKKVSLLQLIVICVTSLHIFGACKPKPVNLKYGDHAILHGWVEKRVYSVAGVDTFEAYMLHLDSQIRIGPSQGVSYGMDVLTDEVHVDRSNEKMLEFDTQEIQVSGRLMPSETAHHLGAVCIEVENIELISPQASDS